MFKDHVHTMIVDEKTAKYASEIEEERKSINALESARASSMLEKRTTTTTTKAIAAAATVAQSDTATES